MLVEGKCANEECVNHEVDGWVGAISSLCRDCELDRGMWDHSDTARAEQGKQVQTADDDEEE